jgi:hypothetical protein
LKISLGHCRLGGPRAPQNSGRIAKGDGRKSNVSGLGAACGAAVAAGRLHVSYDDIVAGQRRALRTSR